MRPQEAADLALSDVQAERRRQDKLWGEQNIDPFTYLTVLMEEVGELSQACLQTRFGGRKGGIERMKEEAIQVAAVALAIVECFNREKWTWNVEPVHPVATVVRPAPPTQPGAQP